MTLHAILAVQSRDYPLRLSHIYFDSLVIAAAFHALNCYEFIQLGFENWRGT